MSSLTFEQIVHQSSFETLISVFGHVAKLLIERKGEAGDLADLPIRDPKSGELIGWLRSLRNEIARMESSTDFRERLKLSLASDTIAIQESEVFRPTLR